MDLLGNNTLIRVPYDNYEIYHPEGYLMCFCSRKKALWYVNRNLAIKLEDNKIQLTFEPNGKGDPTNILQGRKNSCVVSGTKNKLTKHHVIPTQYRKHFLPQYKDKNSLDLVVLNREIHDLYEIEANTLKSKLFEDFVDVNLLDMLRDLDEAKSLYNCINKYYNELPHAKQIYMDMRFRGLQEKWKFTTEQLKSRDYLNFSDHNKTIVDKVGTVNMIVLWKSHFLIHANPNFLPEWWKPNLLKIISRGYVEAKTELVEINVKEQPGLIDLLERYNLSSVY